MTAADDQAVIRADIDRRDKQIVTLKARCALAGYALHILDAGSGISTSTSTSTFMIQKWGLVRELPDVTAVERFLEQAGA